MSGEAQPQGKNSPSRFTDEQPLPPEQAVTEHNGPALEALYRKEAPRLLRSLARRMANKDEAQDLVQESFARLARMAASQWRRLAEPEAYLGEVARNLLRDRAREAGRQGARLHLVLDPDDAPFHDQQRQLEDRDMLNRLDAAIHRLKPKTRDIFIAHRVHGFSYEEIAKRTGLSTKGVEKQMAKAIAHIGRLMIRS